MWVATESGFYSVVAHRDRDGFLLVRARARHDIDAVADFVAGLVMGPAPVPYVDRQADYPHRIEVHVDDWAEFMTAQIRAVDYDNFKNRVARVNPARAHTYHEVWRVLLEIEREPAPRPRRAKVRRKAKTS
jgi:hypothetical protein